MRRNNNQIFGKRSIRINRSKLSYLTITFFFLSSIFIPYSSFHIIRADDRDGNPQARSAHKLVYDETNHKVILFGGVADPATGNVLFDDTWIYDPNTLKWSLLDLDNKPPGRHGHSMVYDLDAKKVLLFGGFGENGILRDIWEFDYDLKTWNERFTLMTPSRRVSSSVVYDQANERTLLLGGYSEYDDQLDDLWAYSYANNSWAMLNLENLESKPEKRYGHTMVYEPNSNSVILFAGRNNDGKMNDTWTFNCTNDTWENKNLIGSPTPRYWYSAILADHRMIIFGGSTGEETNIREFLVNGETWVYDISLNKWDNVTQFDSPSARDVSSMVYDPINQKAILFGGFNKTVSLDDTWELNLKDSEYQWINKDDLVNTSEITNYESGITTVFETTTDISTQTQESDFPSIAFILLPIILRRARRSIKKSD